MGSNKVTIVVSIDINYKSGKIAIPTLKVVPDGYYETDLPIQSFVITDKNSLIKALEIAFLNGNPKIYTVETDGIGFKKELKLLNCKSSKQFERECLPISLTKTKKDWTITPKQRHFPRGFVPNEKEIVILPITTPIEDVGEIIHDIIMNKWVERRKH